MRPVSLIRLALAEDLPSGDLTADLLVSPDAAGRARLVVKSEQVFFGEDYLCETLRQTDPELIWKPLCRDGSLCPSGTILGQIEGRLKSILAAERTLLNGIQYLSGVATLTRRAVELVADLPVRIVDTRKTLPGLRALSKQAVRAGGGSNHRQSLSEHILIKENHIAAVGSLTEAIALARRGAPHLCKIEVEVTNAEEALTALEAGVDCLLLDNFKPVALQDLVPRLRAKASAIKHPVLLEASGGIQLSNLRKFAETGVDVISLGSLTHSVEAADISLLVESR